MKSASPVSTDSRTNTVLLPLPQQFEYVQQQTQKPNTQVFVLFDTRNLRDLPYGKQDALVREKSQQNSLRKSDGEHFVLKLIGNSVKFWLLFIVGFLIACILTAVFGGPLPIEVMITSIGQFIVNAGVIIVCALSFAVVCYSIYQ
jgi:hypothetical protein